MTSYERRQVLFLYDCKATRRVTCRQITAACLSDMKNINHQQPATNTGYAAIHYSNRDVGITSFLVQQNQLVASNNFIASDRGNSFTPLVLTFVTAPKIQIHSNFDGCYLKILFLHIICQVILAVLLYKDSVRLCLHPHSSFFLRSIFKHIRLL